MHTQPVGCCTRKNGLKGCVTGCVPPPLARAFSRPALLRALFISFYTCSAERPVVLEHSCVLDIILTNNSKHNSHRIHLHVIE